MLGPVCHPALMQHHSLAALKPAPALHLTNPMLPPGRGTPCWRCCTAGSAHSDDLRMLGQRDWRREHLSRWWPATEVDGADRRVGDGRSHRVRSVRLRGLGWNRRQYATTLHHLAWAEIRTLAPNLESSVVAARGCICQATVKKHTPRTWLIPDPRRATPPWPRPLFCGRQSPCLRLLIDEAISPTTPMWR